jgi:hypothetical protein
VEVVWRETEAKRFYRAVRREAESIGPISFAAGNLRMMAAIKVSWISGSGCDFTGTRRNSQRKIGENS